MLASHASDADDRKPYTPGESHKHYIDIDNYSDFINHGRIPQTYDSAVMVYGSYFVSQQGILPWAAEASFDSLRNCFTLSIKLVMGSSSLLTSCCILLSRIIKLVAQVSSSISNTSAPASIASIILAAWDVLPLAFSVQNAVVSF